MVDRFGIQKTQIPPAPGDVPVKRGHGVRVAFEKNIDFLRRAAVHVRRETPDVRVLVTGEGPAQASLERLRRARRLEANVRFLGYLARASTLLDSYRTADAFVFAERTETQGLVLLEAMALTPPVIAVADGNKRHPAPDDERHFAARVVTALLDRKRRDALSVRESARASGAAREW